MSATFASLNSLPIPDWRGYGSTYVIGLSPDATPNMEKELAVWVGGKEDDKTFFAHMEGMMQAAADTFIAAQKKK